MNDTTLHTHLTDAAENKAWEEYENHRECGYPPFDDYGLADLCRKLEVEFNRHKELVEIIKRSHERCCLEEKQRSCKWMFELPMEDEEGKIFNSFL